MSDRLDFKDLELNALLEVTQAINNNLPENDLYRIYRFTLLADLKVSRLAMYVKDENWECKVHFGTDDDWSCIELPAAYRDLRETTDVEATDKFGLFDLVFPVSHKEKLLAVVFMSGLSGKRALDNTTFIRALTNILIVAIENKKLARRQLEQEAYRRELEIAKKVQNFLFPKELPKTNRLKIEALYLPHQDVGGDYYDYVSLGEKKFMICVADVSGKGVPAALLMSNFQASLRALIRKTDDLDEIIPELNLATYHSSNGENFITFFIGIYDFEEKQMRYANCGHNPTMIFTPEKMVTLDEGTTVLGMFDPLPFLNTQKIDNLEDFLFFGYTDGLTETFNSQDDQFGLDRLVDLLEEIKGEQLPRLHEHILEALNEFRGESDFSDDITMISCQVVQ